MGKVINFNKEEIDNFVSLINNGTPLREISKTLNCCEETLRTKIKDIYPNLNFKNNRINHDFFNEIGPIQSYVIGFICADGCIKSNYKKEKRSEQWSIEIQDRDIDILNTIKIAMNKVGPVNIRKKLGKKSKYFLAHLRVCSNQHVNKLKELGISCKKTFTLEFPKIFIENKNLFGHFLRGYFDGDGCVYFNNSSKRLHFEVAGNYKFCSKLAQVLKENYNIGSGNCYKAGTIYKISFSGSNIKKIYNLIYKDACNFFLKRKHDKFVQNQLTWDY